MEFQNIMGFPSEGHGGLGTMEAKVSERLDNLQLSSINISFAFSTNDLLTVAERFSIPRRRRFGLCSDMGKFIQPVSRAFG